MVSGAWRASVSAWAMASRTPKQIPKCSAVTIFIYFVTQSLAPKFLFPSRLHNLFQHPQIFLEGRASLGRQGIARLRTIPNFFRHRHQSQFVQSPQMSDEIAIAHVELGFEILKRPGHPRRQQGHDGKSTFLVNRFVEFVEVWHLSFAASSSRRIPEARCINQLEEAEGDTHREIGNQRRGVVFQLARCDYHYRGRDQKSPSQEYERPRCEMLGGD